MGGGPRVSHQKEVDNKVDMKRTVVDDQNMLKCISSNGGEVRERHLEQRVVGSSKVRQVTWITESGREEETGFPYYR